MFYLSRWRSFFRPWKLWNALSSVRLSEFETTAGISPSSLWLDSCEYSVVLYSFTIYNGKKMERVEVGVWRNELVVMYSVSFEPIIIISSFKHLFAFLYNFCRTLMEYQAPLMRWNLLYMFPENSSQLSVSKRNRRHFLHTIN